MVALLREAKRGNANELTDIVWSPSQSSLFWFRSRVPGNGSAGDRDVGSVKHRGSCGVSCAPYDP
jgi:hypothetical protein